MEKQLQNRFRRLEGQIKTLQANIDAGTDCAEVIPQFMAAKGAFSAAFEVYIKQSLDACADHDREKIKSLITILTR